MRTRRGDEQAPQDGDSVPNRLARGIRVALRNDAAAYGYSLLATTTFGVLTARTGDVTVPRVFAFAVGATAAFALLEAIGSKMFRQRIRSERPEVVMLGSALHLVSVISGLAVATLVAWALGGVPAWLLAPFAATVVYMVLTGANMAAACAAEERHPPTESG